MKKLDYYINLKLLKIDLLVYHEINILFNQPRIKRLMLP